MSKVPKMSVILCLPQSITEKCLNYQWNYQQINHNFFLHCAAEVYKAWDIFTLTLLATVSEIRYANSYNRLSRRL